MKSLRIVYISLATLLCVAVMAAGVQVRLPKTANTQEKIGNVSQKAIADQRAAANAVDVAPARGPLGDASLITGNPVLRSPASVMSGSILNVPSTFATIQAAINAASNGDTINVYPGTYNADSANGFDPNTGGVGSGNFNIFVNKSVTIRGVDGSGRPITSYGAVAAHIVASRNVPTFGADAIFVQADNVTITGLDIVGYNDLVNFNNKSVEIAGDNFTMKYCKVDGLDQAAAVYVSDWHYNSGTNTSHVQSYRFEANYIKGGGPDADGIRIASGAGWTGSAANRVITGNTFFNAIDQIAFVGPGAESWDLYPVGAATITGNTFSATARRHVIAWGLYNSVQGYTDPDWSGIVANNTFDKGAILWTPSNTVRSWDAASSGFYYVRGIYSMIQPYAINKAQSGDHVQVLAGTYAENLTIATSLSLDGAGQGVTTLLPAVSDPGTAFAPSFGNSQMIVVSAHNVTIDNMTLDGDNPSLTSGVAVNGADIDARNGIIEADGPWNNTVVHHTTVKNVYLRGVYARSGGSGFNFHDNTVQNVMGSPNSIAMFNFSGTGTFANNTVSQTGDAISANHSRGTQFLNNTITDAGSGIHSDNAGDAGGAADLIQGNSVTNSQSGGYGIWSFVPYIAQTIQGNSVTNVDVGMGVFGGAFPPSPTVTPVFLRNTIDGQSKANSIGFYLTNTTFYYGVTPVAATMANCFVRNNSYGLYLESAAGNAVTMTGHSNAVSGNTSTVWTDSVPAIYGGSGTAGTLAADLRGSWWGSISAPPIGGATVGGVSYSPWLGLGTDADLGTNGFQPLSPMTWYANGSATLQSAIDFVAAGDILNILAGTYTEQLEIAKTLTIVGAGTGLTTVQAPVALTKYFTTSTTNYPVIYGHDANGIVVRSLKIDGAGRANGNYRMTGVGFHNAGGMLDGCVVKDIRETPISGTQQGTAVYAFVDNATPRTFNISNDTIFGFQKNGMALSGNNLTVNVTGNVVTGAGPVSFIAQNGIQISSGATGTISGNTVSQISYTPASVVSCGMLLFNPSGSISTLNNTLSETQMGIFYYNVGGTIAGNTISASAAGCGTPGVWGIDVDPGAAPRRIPSPLEDVNATTKSARTAAGAASYSTTVRGNALTGDGTNGTGLEMDALGSEVLAVTAAKNTITHWGMGVYLYADPTATLTALVDSNTIASNVYGLFNQTGMLQDARQNWWGNANGPRDIKTLPNTPNYNNPGGLGDSVSAFVDYNPWFTNAGMTQLSVYTLTINAANGSVAKAPDQPTYLAGTQVQLTPTPATGYQFTGWSGDASGNANPLTITMDGNKTITATFTILTYSIASSAGANGNIAPLGTATVNYGTNKTYNFTPSAGYHVDSVIVDGSVVPTAASYTFTSVTANHTIRVTFAINQYTLTPSAGVHGQIAPAVPTGVSYGGSQGFTFTPDTGYHVDSLLIDGVPQPAAPSYTFTGVTASHAIHVTFAINRYTLTPSTGSHGTIAPDVATVVDYGSGQTFTFTPDAGYHVDSLIVDGVLQAAAPSYAFTDVTADHAIRVTFAINSYTITPSAGPHGSITPATPVTIAYGGNATFEFIPDSLYDVDSLFIDGVNLGTMYLYTFDNVTEDHTVRVVFRIPPGTLVKYRTFTYEELQVKRGVKNKAVTDYWQFKIKNTSPNPVTQINAQFKNPVRTIYSSGNLVGTGFSRMWSFSGVLAPGDSVMIIGQSGNPGSQTIDKLWFNPSSGLPMVKGIHPIYEAKQYPMPNTANVRDEAYHQGAFSATSGFVVGLRIPDLQRVLGWVRMTTPTAMYQSMFDRAVHSGPPSGFDRFENGALFVREQRALYPRKQNNRLFADLLSFEFNIAISRIGITQKGLGELRYMDPGNPWSGMLLRDLAAKADTAMTMWTNDPQLYYVLDTTLQRINRAFSGPFDTTCFHDSLRVAGVRQLLEVQFLKPTNVPPPETRRISDPMAAIPSRFELFQNYPNPFNPTTTIRFGLSLPGMVTLQIYDILGRIVATVVDHESMNEGMQEVEVDASSYASGIYFYRINVESADDYGRITHLTDVKKMMLIK